MKDSVPVINLNTLQNDILPYLETVTYLMEKKYSWESNQVYKSCKQTDLLTPPLY